MTMVKRINPFAGTTVYIFFEVRSKSISNHRDNVQAPQMQHGQSDKSAGLERLANSSRAAAWFVTWQSWKSLWVIFAVVLAVVIDRSQKSFYRAGVFLQINALSLGLLCLRVTRRAGRPITLTESGGREAQAASVSDWGVVSDASAMQVLKTKTKKNGSWKARMESRHWPAWLYRGDCLCVSTSSHVNKMDFIDALVVSVPRSLVYLRDLKDEQSGPAIQRSGQVQQIISTLKRSGSKSAGWCRISVTPPNNTEPDWLGYSPDCIFLLPMSNS